MIDYVEKARRYLDAYAAKDIDAIAGMIDREVELQDWNIDGLGQEFFIQQTERNFAEASDIQIVIKDIFLSNNVVAAQLHITLDSGAVSLDVVDVITFSNEGLITAIRAYKS